jgi:hypothetical protein
MPTSEFAYDVGVRRLGLACAMAVAGCGRISFGTMGDGGENALGDGAGSLADGDVAPSDTALPTGTGPGGLCVVTATIATGPLRAYEPRTAWNGSSVGLVWTQDPANDGPRLYRTLASGGVMSQVVTLAAASTPGEADIEADGADFRIAWEEEIGTNNREVRRSTNGTAAFALSTSNRFDMWPKIAPLGNGSTAYAWARQRGGGGYDLVLSVVDAGGAVLVQEVVLASAIDTFRLDLVWTGSELVAFYVTVGQLWMRKFGSDGTPLAAAISIATSNTINRIAARWVGDRILVTWNVLRPIRLAHVSPAGTLLTPWQAIDPLMEPNSFEVMIDLQIARGPSSDLLVWNDLFRQTAYVQPVERSGALGQLVQWTGSQGITAVHGGDRWYIGHILAQSQAVEMLELCP